MLISRLVNFNYDLSSLPDIEVDFYREIGRGNLIQILIKL